jgi:hypothetical protein
LSYGLKRILARAHVRRYVSKMLTRLGFTTAALVLTLFTSVALAAAKPPPNNAFYRGRAVVNVASQCPEDNGGKCSVPASRMRNMGVRDDMRIYCALAIPIAGPNKGRHLQYRVEMRKNSAESRQVVSTCQL